MHTNAYPAGGVIFVHSLVLAGHPVNDDPLGPVSPTDPVGPCGASPHDGVGPADPLAPGYIEDTANEAVNALVAILVAKLAVIVALTNEALTAAFGIPYG